MIVVLTPPPTTFSLRQYLFDIATMNCDPADFDSPEVILVLFLLEHFPCLDQIVASWQWSEICEVIVGEGVNQVPVASRGANERALEAILE